MRIKLICQLEHDVINLNYREAIMSYIKNSIHKYDGGQYYNKFYSNCRLKSFCFAVRLPICTFDGEAITLDNKSLNVYLTSDDPSDMVILYNAVNSQKFKPYEFTQNNKITLVNIVMEMEKKITSETIDCQLAMPLAIRIHNRNTNKDRYVLFNDDDFSQQVKENVIAQLEISGLDKSLADNFECTPIRCRKAVVRFKSSYVTGTLGTIRLSGKPQLLDYLYKSGMGSKRSSGFGYFNVIR